MKKLIAIPLLVLYITAISGMMLQFHFCGSKLSSWSVNHTEASCCCGADATKDADAKKENSKKDDDCCKDKTITLKIKQEQNRGNQVELQFTAFQIALLPKATPTFVPTVALKNFTHTSYRANAPPGRWQDIPLYKLHTRFTYYG